MALLVVATDTSTITILTVPVASERYTLAAPAADLQVNKVQLNGVELALGTGDALPVMNGAPTAPGSVSLAPSTMTFLAIPEAGNSACH